VIDLVVHGDARGWFKENWQRAKMTALGVPDFNPVQNNVSFNLRPGVTRGIHAEPWDKLVTVAAGRVFGAWVDLRQGSPTLGRTVTLEIGPETAVFVPRGVGNAYQALSAGAAYSYFVNAHWNEETNASYARVNLADPALGIAWPVPVGEAEISQADRSLPFLSGVQPLAPKSTVVIGANGQLGTELMRQMPDAVGLTRADFDFARPSEIEDYNWSEVDTVFNAAAYVASDLAETSQGRRDCWAVNVTGLAHLVRACRQHRVRLMHISSDYVFDGRTAVHVEDEPVSPLGVYGQTKAAGEALAATLPRHLVLRTSWVIGPGSNFAATMAQRARRNAPVEVVNDQWGRPTFAADLAAAAIHLVEADADPGIYNVSNTGAVTNWWEIARRVYEGSGSQSALVKPISTDEYSASRPYCAPRPRHSAFDLSKLEATGFTPPSWESRLTEYVAAFTATPDASQA
jgi:dTDP-4-dehydrorhamnose 3,5-epimerase